MFDKKVYSNGQDVYKMEGDYLCYYYKDGNIKAKGLYINNLMEGEWKFFTETGIIWQVGSFKHGQKDGVWIRFDKGGEIIYNELFENKKIKKQG